MGGRGGVREGSLASRNGKKKQKVSRKKKGEKKLKSEESAKPLADGTIFAARRFGDVYEEVCGGLIAFDRSVKAWRWVANKYGQDKALRMWRAYLEQRKAKLETQFVSGSDFAKNVGDYDPDAVVADPLSLL
jgi:hypothetical protein